MLLFFVEKMRESFAVQKILTFFQQKIITAKDSHIFSTKNNSVFGNVVHIY